jgi:hypothetical protein
MPLTPVDGKAMVWSSMLLSLNRLVGNKAKSFKHWGVGAATALDRVAMRISKVMIEIWI